MKGFYYVEENNSKNAKPEGVCVIHLIQYPEIIQ